MLLPSTVSSQAVFITGAGSGFSRDLALLAADLGARVFLAGRRENLPQEAATAIEARGGKSLRPMTAGKRVLQQGRGEILSISAPHPWQWLNQGVIALPEPGPRDARVPKFYAQCQQKKLH
jgi:NAD(P)-dependent dehydrogenase (short-subunit alcohol dehydrogenase family)